MEDNTTRIFVAVTERELTPLLRRDQNMIVLFQRGEEQSIEIYLNNVSFAHLIGEMFEIAGPAATHDLEDRSFALLEVDGYELEEVAGTIRHLLPRISSNIH